MMSFLGLMAITFAETIVAFFIPLNQFVECIVSLFGIIGFLLFLRKKNWTILSVGKNLNFWFYILAFLVIACASFSPYFYDHYSYYVPTISYLQEVGFVKGISNLDLLLGQSSFWHIYQAGFSNLIDVHLRINSYVLILFLIYVYESRRWALLIFIPFFLIFVQQPSPDLPIFLIALILVNELLEGRNNLLVLSLSVFAFCIKPSVFWLPLLVFLESLYTSNFRIKALFPIIALGLLFIIKNIWLFGFPVFPASFMDVNAAWKPSLEIRTYSSQIGLMKSYDMKYSYQQISDFSFWEGIFHWFTIGFKSVFNVAIIICFMMLTYLAIKKKDVIYRLILLVFIVKFILIIIFSAQYRFFIDLYLITFFLIFKNIHRDKAVVFSIFFSLLISVIFTFLGFITSRFQMGKWMTGFRWSQLYEPNTVKSSQLSEENIIGNFKFNVPKNPFDKKTFPSLNIYDLKLYHYYGIFPQNSKDGFIQRKLTDTEKIQLKKIIDKLENHNY